MDKVTFDDNYDIVINSDEYYDKISNLFKNVAQFKAFAYKKQIQRQMTYETPRGHSLLEQCARRYTDDVVDTSNKVNSIHLDTVYFGCHSNDTKTGCQESYGLYTNFGKIKHLIRHSYGHDTESLCQTYANQISNVIGTYDTTYTHRAHLSIRRTSNMVVAECNIFAKKK